MADRINLFEEQLKQTCKLAGARWAALIQRSGTHWDFRIPVALSKTRQNTLEGFIQQTETATWLAGALSSGRTRSHNTGEWANSLGCQRLFAFANPSTQNVILVGAAQLSREAQAFFRVLALSNPFEQASSRIPLNEPSQSTSAGANKGDWDNQPGVLGVSSLSTLGETALNIDTLFEGVALNPPDLVSVKGAAPGAMDEKERIEKSRLAITQAEKVAAAGRLTASIAHEINNPLQSLHNCLHLASRKELSEEERQKYLEMAQSELDRLMSLTQRMLDLFRPGARDRKLTDINEVVRRVLLLMEAQLCRSKIVVETHLDTQLPMVMVVSNQIQQVLINLMINSIEAMPDGGEICIDTDVDSERGSGVEIRIEDTGPGIPETERERIFEPFVSTKESGTGLGLAVSYGIMVAHGGTMNLIPGKGKGACFRITLPKGDDR